MKCGFDSTLRISRSFLELCLEIEAFQVFPRDQLDDVLRRVRSGDEVPGPDEVEPADEASAAVALQAGDVSVADSSLRGSPFQVPAAVKQEVICRYDHRL